jgi:hypothetical protein
MKRKKVSALNLSRETILNLDDVANGRHELARARGAAAIALSIAPCTNIISDCKYCTTPLDTCPPVTGTVNVCCAA